MSISLIPEHMLTKTRPVLPRPAKSGQVRPQARRRMKSPHIAGVSDFPAKSFTTLDADGAPPLTGRRLGVSI
jgi:hypothetical protein